VRRLCLNAMLKVISAFTLMLNFSLVVYWGGRKKTCEQRRWLRLHQGFPRCASAYQDLLC
jgi:hypothetical protein